MKRRCRKLLATLLAVVMTVSILPTPALAAVGQLLGNSAVENAALLDALQEAYGEDADAMYAVLEQYGLVDKNGNLVTDEKIVVDGKKYTLDQLEDYLDDPDTDLSKVATVDGTPVTLEDLKKIVEIERYLAYVKAAYFTKQDLTDEQVDSFYSFADALAGGKVNFLAANALRTVGPAGVDHSVKLNVDAAATATENSTYTVTVTPSAPQTEDITFSWRAVGGSVDANGGGEVTIPADSTEPVELTVNVGAVKGRTQGKATFLVQIYDVKNAVLGSDGRWEQQVSVDKKDTFKYQGEATATLSYTGKRYYETNAGSKSFDDGGVWEEYDAGRPSTQRASVSLKVNGLDSGNYLNTISLAANGTLTRKDHVFMLTNLKTPLGNFWGNTIGNSTNNQEDAQWYDSYKPIWNTKYGNPATYTIKIDNIPVVENQSLAAFKNTEGKASVAPQMPPQTYSGNFSSTNPPAYTVSISTQVATYSYQIEVWDHFFFFHPDINIPVTLTAQETTKATTASISAAPGDYYPGQSVPITVKFGFPMVIDNKLTLTVNGLSLHPVETGTTGEVCTFLYPVQPLDGNELTLTGVSLSSSKGANGNAMAVTLSGGVQLGDSFDGVSMIAPDHQDAFTDYKLAVNLDADNRPQLTVFVGLNPDSGYLTWLDDELSGGTVTSLRVKTDSGLYPFTYDAETAGNTLTATIPLDYNTGIEDIQGQVDFILDNCVMMGKGLEYAVAPSIPVADTDMTPKLTVNDTEYGVSDTAPLLYAQQDNALTLDFALTAGTYTWGNTKKLSYFDKDGKLADDAAHFAWRSSDPTVATVAVDSKGRTAITPTGRAGKVEFTLVALNGAMADAESDAITVTFAVGQDPFLLIPQSGQTVSIREGQDAVINWSSNLCQKNETGDTDGAFVPTTFKVTVGYEVNGDHRTAVLPDEVLAQLTTSEDSRIISTVTLPWEGVLNEIYNAGARHATVMVSASYAGKTYGSYFDEMQIQQGNTATATILMISQPASVTLHQPNGGLYQTDAGGKSLTLTWDLAHLDGVTGGQFELYVASTNPAFGTNGILSVTGVDTANELEYTLDIPAVELKQNDPTSYRDTYNITIKAKNAAESTWAYSSYVLYVYSDRALQLLLDGAQAAGSHTMSNVDKIAALWGEGGSEKIVALQRDIALKNVISVNYGEYAWAELADLIAWRSSDSKVATVNYQQGALYENIENFSYTAYRPSTDFILSGLKDGKTTITATHVKTGITDSVVVNVETLRDKLYLFQCYPNNTVTTLTYRAYTDPRRAATEALEVKTNEKGEAAVYAPYGIAGDVYCKSEISEGGQTVTYLGTIYNSKLVSSEADSTKLQLYPVNTLQLRRAAYVDLYLKNPDGSNYTGSVTLTGGVYRQGEYCSTGSVDGVLMGLQERPGQSGETPQTVTLGAGDNGHLRITMDLSQFTSPSHSQPVQAGEKLWYIFQLLPGSANPYKPILLRVNANLNSDDVVATGENILAWDENEQTENGSYAASAPFVAMENIRYSPSATASVADVRKSTGNGPQHDLPQRVAHYHRHVVGR